MDEENNTNVPETSNASNDFLGVPIEPWRHFEGSYSDNIGDMLRVENTTKNLYEATSHFTPETDADYMDFLDGNGNLKFAGSSTLVDLYSESLSIEEAREKRKIMEFGLDKSEEDKTMGGDVPISPIHPFTRMKPGRARELNIRYYNRTRTPIADLEFRRAFKHVFISRPECYLMCTDGVPAEQTEHDGDFMSTYNRMPYVLEMLSPGYVIPSTWNDTLHTNWNWLLTNRLISINNDGKTSIGVIDNVVKSIDGHTITPGRTIESSQGNTITLNFRDTKNLEVYEMIRTWMLYIHKIRKGFISPSYNGYQYTNGFIDTGNGAEGGFNVTNPILYHPYDRALDYCASLFEFITNDVDKILFWQKYYGIYPVDVTVAGLTDSNAAALTSEVTVSASFRYQKKLIGDDRTFVEFNYNTGITDDMGTALDKQFQLTNGFMIMDDELNNRKIITSTDMFVAAPIVIYEESSIDASPTNGKKTLIPFLKFIDDEGNSLRTYNENIVNVHDDNTSNHLTASVY